MSDLIKHYRQLVGIAKGWAMKSLPGWSDDSHRDLLARYGAVALPHPNPPPVGEGTNVKGNLQSLRISASSMNVPQLDAVLQDYERRGWSRSKRMFAGNPSAGSGRTEKCSVPPRIAYMVRMWGKLGTAGKVEHANRKALLAFCARQVARDVPDLDSLTVAECQQITEAMKGWLAR